MTARRRVSELSAMKDEDKKHLQDEARCEAAVQTLKDVIWRFEEISGDTYSIYDILGFLVEDLVREGTCAACVNETLAAVYKDLGIDPNEHQDDGEAVYH